MSNKLNYRLVNTLLLMAIIYIVIATSNYWGGIILKVFNISSCEFFFVTVSTSILILLASGNIMGANMIGGGIGDIFNAVQQDYQHSLIPNAVEGSINSGDVTTMIGANRLHAYRMEINNEYAKIIDNYFSMYGYKVNTVDIPNITGRVNWNYVKTIGANIIGNIPQYDLQMIKNIFDNGVTLWHNSSTFLDYSQNNR